MLEMIWKPTLYGFDTCKEFAEAFRLNRDDLILSNAYIYEPYFGCMENLNCHVIFQEKYGAGEPTDVMVDAILADAAKTSCKRVIAIGGGTVIDIAKVLAVSDGEGVDDLYDKAPDLEKKRELIIIPTTCGTGSEVTNISIMARTRIGTKLGLVSPAMYADYAVLIPQLLEGLPFKVFAASSIDALVHAVESALSPKATPYTKLFGYKAIEMIIRGYQTIAKKGPESRFSLLNDFLLASNYAGLAFGTGSHPTTRLCLETLEKVVTPGATVLDIGCGSGILSIAALLLGAQTAFGVDIDKLAVKTANANALENGFGPDRFTAVEGNLSDKVNGQYDIIVANIVADIIMQFNPQVAQFLKPGGTYITGGIIDVREDEVLASFAANGFTVQQRFEDKGWLVFVLKHE